MATKRERRRLTVDGTEYGWIVRGDSGFMVLSLWRTTDEGSEGQRLRVTFDYASEVGPRDERGGRSVRQRRTITPGVVRQVVERALAKGWDPFHKTGEVLMAGAELGFPDGTDPLAPVRKD